MADMRSAVCPAHVPFPLACRIGDGSTVLVHIGEETPDARKAPILVTVPDVGSKIRPKASRFPYGVTRQVLCTGTVAAPTMTAVHAMPPADDMEDVPKRCRMVIGVMVVVPENVADA
jgi:hypothetical protein